MILKLPENRKRIIDYLNGIDENTFIEEFVIPFFSFHGYQVYRINSHGPGEHGKDIIFSKYLPYFFENEYVSVQAKAEQVTTTNVAKFADQMIRALKTRFALRSGSGALYPHYAVFINARKHSNDAYTEFPQLVNNSHVKILSQENVCELIIQSGTAPKRLLEQLSIYTPETKTAADKAIFDIILEGKPADIDNLLDHKLKFFRDEIGPRTKELVIEYIYDRWKMDSTWVGTVNPMKWFDTYSEFFSQKHSKYLLTVFDELLSSTPSYEALPYTKSVVRKITPELLVPIEGEFVTFCARRVISSPRDRIEYIIEKLKEFVDAKLIKNIGNISLANKVLLMDKYKREGDISNKKQVEEQIYQIVYSDDV